MKRAPFTSCKLRVTSGPVPAPETFLVTPAGSAYRVDRVAGRTLHCTRWPREEVPGDALTWSWQWDRR